MIKNNIAQMRLEFEKKIKEAEIENKLSEPFEDCYFRVLKQMRQPTNKSDGYKTLVCLYKDKISEDPNINDLRECLKLYPITEEIIVNVGNEKYMKLPIEIESSRSWGDKSGKLSVQYVHDEYVMWISIPITGELVNIFDIRDRDVNSCEYDTYTSVHEEIRAGYKPTVQVYNFKGEQAVFYGGHNKLIDVDEINRIMKILKGEEK